VCGCVCVWVCVVCGCECVCVGVCVVVCVCVLCVCVCVCVCVRARGCLLVLGMKFNLSQLLMNMYVSAVQNIYILILEEGSKRRRGPCSSVGIATDYRAGRSEIESRWERDFPPLQTGPEAHPASCTMGTRSFPGVEAAGTWG